MFAQKLCDYLDKYNVKYTRITHSAAFTAQDVAAAAHIPGKELAKTVILKVDDKLVMAVLPASFKVDFDLLKHALEAQTVTLADEPEFVDQFPDCEAGAMPPFGNLYGIEVIVAQSLSEDKVIAFNAGSHRELITMRYADFARLVNPKIIRFTVAEVA